MKALVILSLFLLLPACAGPVTPEGSPTPTSQPTGTAPSQADPSPSSGTPTGQRTPTPMPAASPSPAPTPTSVPPGPAVNVGGTRIPVEVAATPQERSQGLSGRAQLPPGTGMLFIYNEAGTYAFWMVDMQFPLDFVWIGPGCAVVDLTPDVPPPLPDQERGDLPHYRPSEPARYVLEINAGEIAAAGIQIGDQVAFEEIPAGNAEC